MRVGDKVTINETYEGPRSFIGQRGTITGVDENRKLLWPFWVWMEGDNLERAFDEHELTLVSDDS